MTIEDLNKYGANTQEGIQRCVNNEDFYLRMVNRIPGDVNFQKLYDAIEVGDLDGAFEAAHALKGSTGNLALSPIFDPVCEITELLRSRTQMDYMPLVTKIREGRDALEALCSAE
jgi:hypothetical protein